MTVGLLQCDHVAGALSGIAGDIDAMFARWLPVEWRVFDLSSGEAPRADDCDAWVATGSRFSVYDSLDWIGRLACLVREIHAAQVPYLGVCFGHQMIGHALGGRVARSARGWGVGVHHFTLASRESWMEPPLASVSVLMSCQDQVEALPPGAVVLASNDHCPVAMFRCGTLLGIQGHPEWEPPYARALLVDRRDRIGAETAERALNTLSQPRSSDALAQWALRWLSGPPAEPRTDRSGDPVPPVRPAGL